LWGTIKIFFWLGVGGGGGIIQNWKCCGNCIFKSNTLMFNFPIKASFSLWWPVMLYQARITTPSLLLLVASSWYFFVGSHILIENVEKWCPFHQDHTAVHVINLHSLWDTNAVLWISQIILNLLRMFFPQTQSCLTSYVFLQQSSQPAPADCPILDSLQKISALLDKEIQSLVCPSVFVVWTTKVKCHSPFGIHTFPSFLNSGLHLKLW